jgi:hypothetical protein
MAQTSKEIAKLALQLDIKQVTRTTSLLNENQIQKIWNSTPEKFKYSRPAKGGGNWTYIKSSYVRKVLDSVFGFNWSFDIETSLSEAFEIAKITKMCVVKGKLTCRVKSDGQWVDLCKTQFGRAEVKFKMMGTGQDRRIAKDENDMPILLDFGNDMKAATSDALKKCASLFGIGADVYEAGEFQAIELIGSSENSDRAKLTEDRIKKVSKGLKVEEVK